MKKITLSIAVLLMGLIAQAASVSKTQALEIAQQFMSKNSAMRVKGVNASQLQLAHTAVSKVGAVDFYVFNRSTDAGFVIVSGDDQLIPVLGYADSGSFNTQDVPDGLQYWLDEYQRQIEHLKQHPEQARKLNGFSRNVQPMVTTRWNQSSPYNNMCPTYTNNGSTYRAVTGCAATACAQIMNYHKWPKQGTGSHSYQCDVNKSGTTKTLSVDFSQSVYQWDLMDDVYDSNSLATHNAAVAKLMYDVGVSANMSYGAASGAGNGAIYNALINYFGYDKGMRMEIRDCYGIEAWEKMLTDELDARRPVYYTGYTPTGGHAFVFDGYNTDGYFHVNWGWGGSSDGYFIVSMLNPQDQGIGSFEGGYNSNQAIIINFKPDEGGTPADVPLLGTCKITAENSVVNLGTSATFKLTNTGMSGTPNWEKLYWGILATKAVDVEPTKDDIVQFCTSFVNATGIQTGISGYGATVSFTPSSSLANGIYYLRLAYVRNENNNDIGFFKGSTARDYIVEMTVADGKAYFDTHSPLTGLTATATPLTSIYSGKMFEVEITISNALSEYFDNIFVGMSGTAGVGEVSPAMKIAVPQAKSFTFKTQLAAPGTAGEADIVILDCNEDIIGTIPVTVLDGGGSSYLEAYDNFTSKDEMPATDIRASVDVINSGDGVYANQLELFICDATKNTILKRVQSPFVTIPAGGKATINFQGEFAGKVGTQYKIALRNPNNLSAYYLWSDWHYFTVIPQQAGVTGDVNGDGKVDIADINSVINIILELDAKTGKADVNGDGNVDVADINVIIDIMLAQ